MSSNQWEVVTKSKKQKNLDKKVEAHTTLKKLEALGPKLEEIMPTEQYHNIVSGKAVGKNNSPTKSSSSSSTKSKSPKKAIKSGGAIAKTETKKPTQPKAPSKPKSLEAALRNITPDDFSAHVEQLKLTYPGSELLWLKGVASYLNSQLPFDCEPTFMGKSNNYPANLVGQALRRVVVDFLDSMGEANLAYFYHTLLVSMAMDLSKNIPIVGYKLLLQLIGQTWPQICSNNMASSALLRNSYQNRSNICLSILWAIGQGGYKQLMEGLKVWQNLMLANLELKSYSKFVTDYIEKILNSAVDQSLSLNQNEFFGIYYALKANYASIPREQQESLIRSSQLILQKYINSSSKQANLFLTLFREIENSHKHRIELAGCLSCLTRGDDSFKVWKMNYKKQLVPSILLLQKLADEWEQNGPQLVNLASFQNFLLDAQNLNAELELAKKRDPNLNELIEALATVQEKSAQQKKKQAAEQKKRCGCCKWVFGSLFLIGLIVGVLVYDTNVNGKGVFAKSATGKVLKNAGLLPHVEKAWYTTMSASARGYKWAEKTLPPIQKPAFKLAKDLYKLTRNTACNAFEAVKHQFNGYWPVVAKFLDQYVPGLSKKLENSSLGVKNIAVDVFGKAVVFFKTQVFVGRFSPDNISKAVNQTQNLALEYYNLFHKKVDAYAKLK